MDKKAIVYFVFALLIISSVSLYFISKEVFRYDYEISGEYDIWLTESEYSSRISFDLETQTEFLYLDINSASAYELTRLDGIGEVIAEKIVSYRADNGKFNSIEEIMNVNGIGEKTFLTIREHIYVENSNLQPADYFSDSVENDEQLEN